MEAAGLFAVGLSVAVIAPLASLPLGTTPAIAASLAGLGTGTCLAAALFAVGLRTASPVYDERTLWETETVVPKPVMLGPNFTVGTGTSVGVRERPRSATPYTPMRSDEPRPREPGFVKRDFTSGAHMRK